MFFKQYPYLQNSYYENANEGMERREVLKKIDDFINQKQYVKITLLSWDEVPLKEIQGNLTTGSISKDGNSAVRRSASFSAVIDGRVYDVDNLELDFSVNKKMYLEVGIENKTGYYEDYPILWFPQGLFIIGNFSFNSSTSNGVSISLTCKDKMSTLNGDVGGMLPATTIFDEEVTQDPTGKYVTQKIPVYKIIQEAVHHFGGEDLNNIVIEDVDLRIKRVMKWTGDNPLYLIPQDAGEEGNVIYIASTNVEDTDGKAGVIEVHNGDDCGYIYDDFFYTTELTLSLGDTVCTLLDKIKSYLGNYEYFYDEFGVFHFREIKNYLNTTQGKIVLSDMDKNDYLVDTTLKKSVYTFSDDTNIVSINVVPQYNNIKNDYIVQGLRKMTTSNVSYPVRYHLAIDEKPRKTYTDVNNPNQVYEPVGNFLLYKEVDTDILKGVFPIDVGTEASLPEVGNFNVIYRYKPYRRDDAGDVVLGDDGNPIVEDGATYSYWQDKEYVEVNVLRDEDDNVVYYSGEGTPEQNWINFYWPKDWRTVLYIQGLYAKNNGTDQGYYFAELENEWPQLYDLYNQKFFGELEDEPLQTVALTDGNYFLDFIDPSTTALGKFSISAIGRRTDAVNNEDINCLFTPEVPNVIFINNQDDNAPALREEANRNGIPWSQTTSEIYWALTTGGVKNGAFAQIKYELLIHTSYQRTVSMTAVPVYYLEPNSLVTINDHTTNTKGDFIVSNINIPLGAGSVMSISASENFERF